MIRFLLIQTLIVVSSLTLTAQIDSSADLSPAPASIYETEAWKKLKPGSVYQGSLKLNSAVNNNWPLQWMIEGEHIAFTTVPEGWARKKYFGKQQTPRIYDPQQYLTETDREVLLDILKKHEEYSMIPIHLCIFGEGQRTEHISPELVSRSFLGNENAALMYYFVGDAKATIGFVNAKQKAPVKPDAKPLLDSFLVKAMFSKAGAHAASLKTDPKETMYATVAEVSRRMYWIEQELGLVKSADLLLDDHEPEAEEEEKPSTLDNLWQQLGGSKQNFTFFSVGILVAIGFILMATFLMIYRRIKVYHFPLYEGPKRLGAEFGASVGRVVRFKSAMQAPQDQKKQLDDSEL